MTTVTESIKAFRDGHRAIGAVEMVVGLGVTVIALYIIILIAGSFSGAASSITGLPSAWQNVLSSTDAMAGSTFNIASPRPACNRRCWYPRYCDWWALHPSEQLISNKYEYAYGGI